MLFVLSINFAHGHNDSSDGIGTTRWVSRQSTPPWGISFMRWVFFLPSARLFHHSTIRTTSCCPRGIPCVSRLPHTLRVLWYVGVRSAGLSVYRRPARCPQAPPPKAVPPRKVSPQPPATDTVPNAVHSSSVHRPQVPGASQKERRVPGLVELQEIMRRQVCHLSLNVCELGPITRSAAPRGPGSPRALRRAE